MQQAACVALRDVIARLVARLPKGLRELLEQSAARRNPTHFQRDVVPSNSPANARGKFLERQAE